MEKRRRMRGNQAANTAYFPQGKKRTFSATNIQADQFEDEAGKQ